VQWRGMSDEWRAKSSELGIVGTHPGSFRKSGKQRSCGIRNLEEDTEDGRTARVGLTGLAKLRSIIHDPCYHELKYRSTIILVQFLTDDPICSKDFVKRRKQMGRAHCVPAQCFKSCGMRKAQGLKGRSQPRTLKRTLTAHHFKPFVR
jgi:hypothetical protein